MEKLKDFFVKNKHLVFIIMFLFFIFTIVGGVIKSGNVIVRTGKDVHIYKGMSTGLRAYKIKSLKMADGNTIFVVIGIKNYLTRNLWRTVYKINAYIYDTKKHTFKKIKFKYASLELPSAINSENKFIYPAYKTLFDDETIHVYDIKNQKLNKTELCNFSKKCNLKPNNLHFIKQIAPDTALVMSQNNKLSGNPYDVNELKNKENMYFFDLKKLTFKKLPDFAIPLKYYPQENDILTLKNGNFLILGRGFGKSKMLYDHIEIYDAKQNKFIAEKNTKFIEDNIFTIDLENGNILFINTDSSFYFNVEKNKFEKTDSYESGKNKIAIYQLKNKLKETFNIYLYPEQTKRVKYIKIAPQKYLITCGDVYMDFPYKKNPNGVCKKSLIYDYQTNTIKQGPNFVYKHYQTAITPLGENTYAIGGIINPSRDYYYPTNKNLQIITVK